MKKNYTLFAFLCAVLLGLAPLKAQKAPLSFKELQNEWYFTSIADAMKSPGSVYKLVVQVDGQAKLPAQLQKLPNLQMLALSGNTRRLNWTNTVAELSKLKNLQYIYFMDSGLTALPTQIFSMSQLKGLAAMNNSLKSIPPQISQLTNLEYLSLINTRVSTLPAEIGTLKNLKTLILDDNNISVLPATMANLKKLEELTIVGTPIKEEELKKLRKALPKVKIIEEYVMPAVENYAE